MINDAYIFFLHAEFYMAFLIFFFFKNKPLGLRFSLSFISVILSNIALKDSLSLNEFLSSFTAPLSPFSCLLILAYALFSCRLLQKPPLETLQSYSVMLFFQSVAFDRCFRVFAFFNLPSFHGFSDF